MPTDSTDTDIPDNKLWDGRKKTFGEWYLDFSEELNDVTSMSAYIKTRMVHTSSGKVIVDSKAAISAIQQGKQAELSRRCDVKTPYPPGKYLKA